MSTAILVAGMHRSGTSATTGALSMCGVALGSSLIPAAEDNPKGYWESADAVSIHDELLHSLDRSWDDIRALPDGWETGAPAFVAAAAIEELILREFAHQPIWAIKDPRICRFIPLWTSVLQRLGIKVVVLFVVRKPSEVAASITARNGWLGPIGDLLWMRHVFEAEHATQHITRCVITYEEILADALGSMERAASRLGVTLPNQTDSVELQLRAFVSPDGRHHQHEVTNDVPNSLNSSIAERAYGVFVEIAKSNEGWNAVHELAVEFHDQPELNSKYLNAVADSAWKLRARVAESQIERIKIQSDLYAQIQWSEEAVGREQELTADRVRIQGTLDQALQHNGEQLESLMNCRKDLGAAQYEYQALQRDYDVLLPRHDALRQDHDTLRQEHDTLRQEHDTLRPEHDALRQEHEALRLEYDLLKHERDQIVGSYSWRMTLPLRWVLSRVGISKSRQG
jgi:hypothetical protein